MTKSKPPQAGVTRKHLARAERETLLRRWVLLVTGSVAALIVAIIGYAVIDQTFIQPRQPVAKVGDVEITTASFQKEVDLTWDSPRGGSVQPVLGWVSSSDRRQVICRVVRPTAARMADVAQCRRIRRPSAFITISIQSF